MNVRRLHMAKNQTVSEITAIHGRLIRRLFFACRYLEVMRNYYSSSSKYCDFSSRTFAPIYWNLPYSELLHLKLNFAKWTYIILQLTCFRIFKNNQIVFLKNSILNLKWFLAKYARLTVVIDKEKLSYLSEVTILFSLKLKT